MPTNTSNFFVKESAFEDALVEHLQQHGWEEKVIMQPTEEDLVKNWADIIYGMNRGINQLDQYPLTSGEMQQIINQLDMCTSPYERNRFINAGLAQIKRDNREDKNNYGKNVYLKIFDAQKISSGESRYQIVRQPKFKTSSAMQGDRRGDVMLLINGMPVIHIELKRSKVDISQAVGQIKRYTHEGVFDRGIFSLVQIFVAMNPEKAVYFANPGKEERFMEEFQFHWADFNNDEAKNWRQVATDLLSIPMAHQMIGYYTIADDKDKTLKVLRSYQYHAVSKICDRTHLVNWDTHQHRGGYIWHTTGSGKTMTSFKAAQLIANSGDADKVIFLMDRIELSTQSLDEYRGFAGETDEVQDTEDTSILVSKLESTDNDDRLIVTSIQKMSLVRPDKGIPQSLIDRINGKRLVFIVDECHRSVFGGMLVNIKNTFPRALLFGFTGTPVFEENSHNEITTQTLFGDMLHKYTIANAIPDGNVLGFDLYKVETYDENELREKVAFNRLGIKSIDEIENDEQQMAIYNHYIDRLKMQDTYMEDGHIVHGIEHYLPKDIYQQDVHHKAVAKDIADNFRRLSDNGTFHAILATQNIPEAIAYYNLFKAKYPELNVVTVFDNNIDNSDQGIAREDAIVEMLTDYNAKYKTSFQLSTYSKYKKDVAKRLSHKKPYTNIDGNHAQQIDLLIVVTQMLTGYDSKWVNTLYVDKVMKYVDIIQAFSRTNRLFGPQKPFGTIRYYSFPATMEQNINDALEVYADRPLGFFVDQLENNLMAINQKFLHIRDIFFSHEIFNFEKLPETREDRNMFAKDFADMTHKLQGAKLQGFLWDKTEYEFQHGSSYTKVKMEINEETYDVLLRRYRELFGGDGPGTGGGNDFEYPIDTYIAETGTGTIDAEYIDSKFTRFVKNLYNEGPGSDVTKAALRELHKTFASLSQKDQRTAQVILHDIQSGDLHLELGKTIQDYISEYQLCELKKQIDTLSEATGLNKSQLINIMTSGATEANLNDHDRFDELKNTLDLVKTKAFVEKVLGGDIKPRYVMVKADELLRLFILDPEMRERILIAYLNDDLTLETAKAKDEETAPTETPVELPSNNNAIAGYDVNIAKAGVRAILEETLVGQLRVKSMDKIVDSVFDVLGRPSVTDLDGISEHIELAFYNLFQAPKIKMFLTSAYFNLAGKFEAYLKKLYFLMHGYEVPAPEGQTFAMLSNVLDSFPVITNLNRVPYQECRDLGRFIKQLKHLRNRETHVSPNIQQEELELQLRNILTAYFYVTSACIDEIPTTREAVRRVAPTIEMYAPAIPAPTMDMAADAMPDLGKCDEPTRAEIIRSSINAYVGYDFRRSRFRKKSHWIAIYRVCVDCRLLIEGDYSYFVDFIRTLGLTNVPPIPTPEQLKSYDKPGVQKPLEEWTAEGLEGTDAYQVNVLKPIAEQFLEKIRLKYNK